MRRSCAWLAVAVTFFTRCSRQERHTCIPSDLLLDYGIEAPPRRRSRPRSTGSPSSATKGRNIIPRSSGSGPTPGPRTRPFLQFDNAIRQDIYTTNAIESVNARIRRAVKARGHFPTEAAALKCVYLAIMSLDPKGTARQRWSNRWKAALNAFEITFDGRLPAGRK